MPNGFNYPAPMEFELRPGPIRDQVLAAAASLGLRVKHWDALTFSVIVTTHMEAYDFGARSGLAVLLRKPPDKTRRIDLDE